MITLMACAILMAVAIPYAFDARAGLFVGAYVVMALVFRGQQMGQSYKQLFAWSGLSGLFWIAGVLLPEWRLPLWLAAVVIDYGAPFIGFWLPRVGATPMESWSKSRGSVRAEE